ncbi:MAG: putative N-acetyltransferase [Candidatus Methanolliviera sp. GoM_oil]|nr:MAG: putative N-acetyltransferase [Candidatus Methanolliviera sp. GoM_oil]
MLLIDELIVIRQFCPSDFPQVIEIEREVFDEDNTLFYMELSEFFPDSFYVACENQRVSRRKIGDFAVSTREGVMGFVLGLVTIEDEGRIFSLAVKEKYRGIGIGSSLLEKIMSVLEEKGVKRIRLEVKKDNIIAQTLYKRMGFVEKMIIPAYYKDGSDAILMIKRLEGYL